MLVGECRAYFGNTLHSSHCTIFPRYSTGSNLNTYSALIQNFYSQETAPHQAIHVAVNTGVEEGEAAGVRAYIRSVSLNTIFNQYLQAFCTISSPVGVFPKPENCVFVPVPVELRFHDAERSGRQYNVYNCLDQSYSAL